MIPFYNDGYFELYRIEESDDLYATKKLVNQNTQIWYEELSITDKLRSQLNYQNVDATLKLRIPQYKLIDANCVIKILDKFYKVYNAYHFTNNDGFKQTDLTLTNWSGDEYDQE